MIFMPNWEIEFSGFILMESENEPTQAEINQFLNDNGITFHEADVNRSL